MSLGTILLIILIVALLGGIPTSGYGYGNRSFGLLGVVLVIIVVLLLLGRI